MNNRENQRWLNVAVRLFVETPANSPAPLDVTEPCGSNASLTMLFSGLLKMASFVENVVRLAVADAPSQNRGATVRSGPYTSTVRLLRLPVPALALFSAVPFPFPHRSRA